MQPCSSAAACKFIPLIHLYADFALQATSFPRSSRRFARCRRRRCRHLSRIYAQFHAGGASNCPCVVMPLLTIPSLGAEIWIWREVE